MVYSSRCTTREFASSVDGIGSYGWVGGAKIVSDFKSSTSKGLVVIFTSAYDNSRNMKLRTYYTVFGVSTYMSILVSIGDGGNVWSVIISVGILSGDDGVW